MQEVKLTKLLWLFFRSFFAASISDFRTATILFKSSSQEFKNRKKSLHQLSYLHLSLINFKNMLQKYFIIFTFWKVSIEESETARRIFKRPGTGSLKNAAYFIGSSVLSDTRKCNTATKVSKYRYIG